jgi:hypothetical protein
MAFLDGAGSSYIYLYMENAQRYGKLRVFTQSMIKTSSIVTAAAEKYEPAIQSLSAYAKESTKFEQYLGAAVNGSSFGKNPSSGMISISSALPGDISVKAIAAQAQDLNAQAILLKEAIGVFSDILNNMETINNSLANNILDIAMENEYVRSALGLVIPDGAYGKTSSSIQQKIETNLVGLNNKIEKLNNMLPAELGGSFSDISSFGKMMGADGSVKNTITVIKRYITILQGYLYKVEILNGLVNCVVKGNEQVLAVVPTSSAQTIKIDPSIKSDLGEGQSLLSSIKGAAGSLNVVQPKADLTCGVQGEDSVNAVFGVTVKAISPQKYQEGLINQSTSKRYAIDLGNTSKTVGRVMEEHAGELSSAVGGQDIFWYSKQILAGLPGEYPGKYTGLYSEGESSSYGQYTKAWNQVLNMCSTLTLTDALVGISQGVKVNYFVVNNKIYKSSQVLNAVLNNLSSDHISGVFGSPSKTINKGVGLEIQRSNYVLSPTGTTRFNMTSSKVRSGFVNAELDALLYSTMLKTKISLGALVKYSGLQSI